MGTGKRQNHHVCRAWCFICNTYSENALFTDEYIYTLCRCDEEHIESTRKDVNQSLLPGTWLVQLWSRQGWSLKKMTMRMFGSPPFILRTRRSVLLYTHTGLWCLMSRGVCHMVSPWYPSVFAVLILGGKKWYLLAAETWGFLSLLVSPLLCPPKICWNAKYTPTSHQAKKLGENRHCVSTLPLDKLACWFNSAWLF